MLTLLILFLCSCEAAAQSDRKQQRTTAEQHTVHEENITALLQQNVTLNCSAPRNVPIKAVKWTKDGLGDEYVLFFRDGVIDPDNQHRSFENRVQPADLQMDLRKPSVILLNVTSADDGTFRVFIKYGEQKIKTKLICIVNLKTAARAATGNATTGHKYGYFGLIGVPLLIGFVKFYLNKAKRKQFKYRANQIIYKLSPKLQNLQ